MTDIKIQGKYVEFYEKQVIASTTLDEFKNSLIAEYGIETPFFSDKCRFYKKIGGKEVVAFQFDKQIRTIKYRHEKNNPECEVKEFKISVPPMIFVWINKICYIYFTNERLKSKDTPLWFVKFTNVWGDGKICLGDVGKDIVGERDLFIKEKLCEEFFATEFNSDLNDRAHDYKQWENETKENEDCYKQFFEREQSQLTFQQVLYNLGV